MIGNNDLDTTKHDLSEQDFYFALLEDGIMVVDGHINKQDAIAIAKALGVTAEDLK